MLIELFKSFVYGVLALLAIAGVIYLIQTYAIVTYIFLTPIVIGFVTAFGAIVRTIFEDSDDEADYTI